jgi:hypothetical protein
MTRGKEQSGVFDRLWPRRETIIGGAVLVNSEILLLLVYFITTSSTPSPDQFMFYVYPFIWINVAFWALWRIDVPTTNRRRRLIAGLIAAGYFLVLGYLGGLYGLGLGPITTGFRVSGSLPPGWGPALLYGGEYIRLALLPFKVIGYLTLSYLIYVTVLDTATSAVAGLLGLFSCISCTLPFIAAVLGGIIGGGGVLIAAASAQSYPLSTAVFVVTVLLLLWRPTAGSFSRLRSNLG